MNKQYSVSGILVISVLLNAFLIGFVFSRCMTPPMMPPFMHEGMMHGGPGFDGPGGPGMHGPHGPGGPEHFMDEAVNVLPEDEQAKVTALIDANHQNMEEDIHSIHDLVSQLRPVLIADKLDEKKLSDIEKKIDAQDAKLKQDTSKLMHTIATALPDEDRINFFKAAMHEPPEFAHP